MNASTPDADAPKYGGPLGWARWLYDWVLGWAASPFGPAALFVLAFVESSFFPIPPDPLLIALCLGMVTRSWRFAALCTAGSVLGGLFGYWIGQNAFEIVGQPILEFYGKVDDFELYRLKFREEGNIAVLLAAITPIPYKLVTITAGAAGMNVPAFTVASVVGRGFRFFAVAGLIRWKGEAIAGMIEKHFDKLTIAFGVLLVGGFVVIRMFFGH